MFSKTRIAFVLVVFALAASLAFAAEKSPYLNDKGELKAPLEVKVLQGGFVGFSGSFIILLPDGTWESGKTLNDDKTAGKSGKYSKEKLAQLVKELEAQNLVGLGNFGGMQVNPRIVTITFGTKSVSLRPGPQPGADNKTDVLTRERYNAIIQAVKAVIQ